MLSWPPIRYLSSTEIAIARKAAGLAVIKQQHSNLFHPVMDGKYVVSNDLSSSRRPCAYCGERDPNIMQLCTRMTQ